jgi:hypothetical protein
MTMVRPAGPMFFCAPPKIRPYFDTSIARDRMCEDMSATTGTSARPSSAQVGLEGVLDAADGLVGAGEHVGRIGGRASTRRRRHGVKPLASVEAAMFTSAYLRASFCDFCDHEPVTT